MYTGRMIDELIATVERVEDEALITELRAIQNEFSVFCIPTNNDSEVMVGAA
jgi:hypothetical protein